jgi:hypothetical protein
MFTNASMKIRPPIPRHNELTAVRQLYASDLEFAMTCNKRLKTPSNLFIRNGSAYHRGFSPTRCFLYSAIGKVSYEKYMSILVRVRIDVGDSGLLGLLMKTAMLAIYL